MDADFSGGAPGWALGQQGYTFAADGTVLAAIREKGQPTSKLMVFGAEGEHAQEAEYTNADGLPFR